MTRRVVHIRIFYLLALLLPLVGGCTKEDWSDCDPLLRIDFSFTHNPTDSERFCDEVTKVELYIFDEQGLFVKSLSAEKPKFAADFALETELPGDGIYTFVATGNVNGMFHCGQLVDFASGCCELEPGVSTISQFRLMYKQVGGVSGDKLDNIFHGIVRDFEVKSEITNRCSVSMVKNTNTINVTVVGLNLVTRSLYPTVALSASAGNGTMAYDNRLDTSAPVVTYRPYARTIEGRDLKTSFSVLGLTTGLSMPLRITHNGADLRVVDLVQAILESPEYNNDSDLLREDTYDIKITFGTGGSVTIEVNGWTSVGSGSVIS